MQLKYFKHLVEHQLAACSELDVDIQALSLEGNREQTVPRGSTRNAR